MNQYDLLIDEMLSKPQSKVMNLKISQLRPFEGHPYKVLDDESMEELTESIRTQGILSPLAVRPLGDEEYEVISGHRRLFACKKADIDNVPAIVHDIDRDQAAIALVDSNLHRESILPSEKAYAYKLKLDAMKHQGQTCGQVGHKSRDLLSDTDSGRQVQRYIRLTNLIPELLEKVDTGQIALSPGVELSYLDTDTQRFVLESMELEDCTPSFSQTVRMKNMYREGKLTADTISAIMAEEKANQKETVRIPKERLRAVLPSGMDARKTEEYIVKACEYYRRYLQRQHSQER